MPQCPVDNICRTCLLYNGEQSLTEFESGEIGMVSIFCVPEKVEEERSFSLREMIKATLPQLEIKENDQLPKNVCNSCSEKIKDIYNFQLKCIRNEEKFLKLLAAGDISELFNNIKDEMEIVVEDAETEIGLFNQSQPTEMITDEILIEKTFTSEESNNSSDRLICDESKLNIVEREKLEKRSNKSSNKKAKQISSKRPIKSRQLNAKEFYSCGKCQRKLKSKLSLIKHHELHVKKDNEEKQLKCNVCNQAFEEMSTFKEHQRTHSAEKPFLCSVCGKGFTSAGSLKQHSFRHLDKKLYPCSECPKSFPTNGDLLCHYEIHKAKPRIHVCDVCGRGFYKPFLLKQHQRYHNNERPFACEFCEKRFVTLEKQRRHTRTHTGEKPYRCKYCDRAFAQSNDCIKHLRQHLGDNVYQCELCPLRFPLARDLRVHFASHKDDDDETRFRNMNARKEEEKKLQIKLS